MEDELTRAVSIIAREHIEDIIKIRRRNFLRSYILILSGFLIVFTLPVVMVFVGLPSNQEFLVPLIAFAVGLALISQGGRFLSNARNLRELGGGKYKLITVLACTNHECDFQSERSWEEGDFIGKILDEKCEKCGANLQVIGIYGISEGKLKPIPLLPGLTQSLDKEKRWFKVSRY